MINRDFIDLAKKLYPSGQINLEDVLGFDLRIQYWGDQVCLTYTAHDKPRYYMQAVRRVRAGTIPTDTCPEEAWSVRPMIYHDKVQKYSFPYPTYEQTVPAYSVSGDDGMFGPVTKWIHIPESKQTTPDYQGCAEKLREGIMRFWKYHNERFGTIISTFPMCTNPPRPR